MSEVNRLNVTDQQLLLLMIEKAKRAAHFLERSEILDEIRAGGELLRAIDNLTIRNETMPFLRASA